MQVEPPCHTVLVHTDESQTCLSIHAQIFVSIDHVTLHEEQRCMEIPKGLELFLLFLWSQVIFPHEVEMH